MVPSCDLRFLTGPLTITQAGSTTHTAQVDTLGYDYLIIVGGDSSANKTGVPSWQELRIGESPTAPTAWADVTAIVPFEGGTETDATHGFTIVTPGSTNQVNGFQFNIDLRGRERYILIQQDVEVVNVLCSMALLFKQERGAEAANVATDTPRARTIVSG